MILISISSNRTRFFFNYLIYIGSVILGLGNLGYLLGNISELSASNYHSLVQLILLQSAVVFFILMLVYLAYKINELEDLLLKTKENK